MRIQTSPRKVPVSRLTAVAWEIAFRNSRTVARGDPRPPLELSRSHGRPDLLARGRERYSPRSARAAAPDPVLSLAWLAPDRSELRAVAREPALRAARRRTLAGDTTPASHSGGTGSLGVEASDETDVSALTPMWTAVVTWIVVALGIVGGLANVEVRRRPTTTARA